MGIGGSRRRWLLLLAGAALLALGLLWLVSMLAGGEAALAVLATYRGSVTRDTGQSMGAWRAVAGGDELFRGDGVKTAGDGRADLTMAKGGTLSLGPNTLVRFGEPEAGAASLVVAEGRAELSASGEALTLRMGQGRARISAGATLTVSAKDGAVTYEVRSGTARISGKGGEVVLTAEHSHAKFDISGVVLPETQVLPPPAPPPEMGAEDAGVEEVAAPDNGTPPTRSQLAVRAGESFVVHDPSPPTAVGFRFGSLCKGGGTVELLVGRRVRASAAGDAKANLAVPVGSFHYRVHCANARARRMASEGTIRVVKDAGSAALPPSPPPTEVDTDGRSYRVLYQNSLPDITVRWPNPAPAARYELVLTGGDATRILKTPKAEHVFQSGEIGEGTYSVVYQVAGDPKQQSRATDLSVRFDNASPTARLMEPQSGTFGPGSTVRVAGIAAEGWRVSIGDTEIPLDRQRRFSANWSVPPEQDGIAVRLAHPRHGVHYYLRKGR